MINKSEMDSVINHKGITSDVLYYNNSNCDERIRKFFKPNEVFMTWNDL